MDAVILMCTAFTGYIAAYHIYGKYLAVRIFKLDNLRKVPSVEKQDGIDFVPTKKGIIFGHHYTSIAGTGPIVGPAIGIIWGWVPALIWVFLGSIFMGAVHDLSALVISLRNEGKSISDITAKYIGSRVRYIFFMIVFLELLIVIAIFGMIIAIIFAIFRESVFAVWMQIPIAVGLGWAVYKKSGNVTLFTLAAVVLMYGTVLCSAFIPVLSFTMPDILGLPPTGIWTLILLIYAFIASTLPVTALLQPRDYINAWQLMVAMGLMVLGVLAAGLFGGMSIAAPALNLHAAGAPPMWPILFITIACGAISGFHCLVSSGTSSKQLACEKDALFVGYGSMLLEAALATLVIIAVAAGIGMAYKTGDGTILTGAAAWNRHYASWTAVSGLGSKLNAVVIGSANMMASIGIPGKLAVVIMGVFIASFAGTTLDSATRIQRYVVSEIFSNLRVTALTGKYTATAFAVLTAAALAFGTGADGKGALKLWPLFGAVNQMLAALALMVATIYLKNKGGRGWLLTGLPCVFMLTMTLWGVALNQLEFLQGGKVLLSIINLAVLVLALWMTAETAVVFFRRKAPMNPG